MPDPAQPEVFFSHMDRYLEELEWRFNNRNNPNIFQDTMTRIVKTEKLTYKELVA